jgi:hypothetical protein
MFGDTDGYRLRRQAQLNRSFAVRTSDLLGDDLYDTFVLKEKYCT